MPKFHPGPPLGVRAATRFFLFNDPPTTVIYTLSLHDALPIWPPLLPLRLLGSASHAPVGVPSLDRKSTRLNSSHITISYAVFCLKKKITPTKSLTSSTTPT